MMAMTEDKVALRPMLDLSICAHVQRHGDIQAHLTWTIDGEIAGEPCIVLTSMNPRPGEFMPCIVTLRSAFKWSEAHADSKFISANIRRFCMCLGFASTDMSARRRILWVIREYLGDLLAMKPVPNETRGAVAEGVRINLQTGKATEFEVIDHVSR